MIGPCATCKGDNGGSRCLTCDRIICFECTLPVQVGISAGNANGRTAWRCKLCVAELVLSGQGVPSKVYESIEDGMVVDKIVFDDWGPK